MGFAAAMTLYAGIDWSRLPTKSRRKISSLKYLSFGRWMTLADAAVFLCDEFRDTALAAMVEWGAEQFGDKSPNGILESWADQLRYSSIPIFGRKPPGTVIHEIPKERFRPLLFPRFGNNPEYADLKIRRSDLRKAIAEIKAELPNIANRHHA